MGPKPLQGKRLSDIKINKHFNTRTLLMPIVAFTMAGLLFVYTRSSIYAAKRNAERHREADGGQISWRNESQRRHGVLEKPQEQDSIKELLGKAKNSAPRFEQKGPQVSAEDETLRARKGTRTGDQG